MSNKKKDFVDCLSRNRVNRWMDRWMGGWMVVESTMT